MNEVTLPVGIQADIEDTFCFSQERGYQDRCHEYIDRYEVTRPWKRGNTAVWSVVEDLCRRSFEAGMQFSCADPRPIAKDAVGEVIRCRDCAHMYEVMDGYECERMSGQYYACEPDGFCSWAERRQA